MSNKINEQNKKRNTFNKIWRKTRNSIIIWEWI